MTTFEWKDCYSVGHEVMDQQHRQIFAMANDLYEEIERPGGASDRLLMEIIATLCDYTRSHFADEEQLLLEIDYPGYERHKQLHDALISRVEELDERLRNGEADIAARILSLLVREWMSRHIYIEDQLYAGYLVKQAGCALRALNKTVTALQQMPPKLPHLRSRSRFAGGPSIGSLADGHKNFAIHTT